MLADIGFVPEEIVLNTLSPSEQLLRGRTFPQCASQIDTFYGIALLGEPVNRTRRHSLLLWGVGLLERLAAQDSAGEGILRPFDGFQRAEGRGGQQNARVLFPNRNETQRRPEPLPLGEHRTRA
jgi:hypothetical protein